MLNSSRSGTISPSTLAVRSESARAIPATKAPARPTPRAQLAAKAVPIASTATPMTKSSREPRRATGTERARQEPRAGEDHDKR